MLKSGLLSLVLLSFFATSARADSFAPLDRPGPALSVAPALLAGALQCQPAVQNATVAPVLLNPATGVTPDQNYSWNYERSLNALGIPWCAYTAPSHTLDDIQTSGEYLVYAIRTMYAMAHRRIDIVGHSQGGMSMRWALRFWPDTRSMVDDVVGFSGSNHGTTVVGGTCAGGCPPAVWQQGAGASFIAALNSSAETFPGVSYTNIFTHTDEVVQPNSGPGASAALHTGGGVITNVATQDVCPLDVYEHLSVGTVDPVAYALAIDALTNQGPADPARVSSAVCSQLYQPGVDPTSVNAYEQVLAGAPGLVSVSTPGFNLVGAPEVKAEPPLRCYVFASCTASSAAALAPPGSLGSSPISGARSCSKPRLSFAIHQNNGRVRRVLVYVNRRRVLARRGRRITRVSIARPAAARYTLRVVDFTARGLRVTTTRRYAGCSKTRPRVRVKR
ncbi:MAG: lipase family alpha/beta hydrolase [Solirubrobacteraceae bacterium]